MKKIKIIWFGWSSPNKMVLQQRRTYAAGLILYYYKFIDH